MKRPSLSILALGVVAGLTGCATTETPRHDASFGQAVLAARATQTLQPDAPVRTPITLGLDGRAARSAVERYQDSYRTPAPTFSILNIGGSLGNGQ